MSNRVFILIILWLLPIVGYSQSVHKVIWMTEEYPPLNYSEEGVRKGQFVEILIEIWKKLGVDTSPKQIKILPWARAYKILQTKPGTALFSMSRTKEREHLFQWVGPVDIPPIGIIAKKSKGYRFSSIEEINLTIQSGRMGVVRSDSGEQYFLEKKGDPNLLFKVTSGTQLVKMLKIDRIDAIAYLQNVTVYFMKQNKIDVSQYEFVYPLTEGAQGWYGFHKRTDPQVIRAFQDAFNELVSDGVIDKINSKYLQ